LKRVAQQQEEEEQEQGSDINSWSKK